MGKESDFISEVAKSRLAIHTANETTYLETLAANFPTLVFWDPNFYEVRPELQVYFDALVGVGILHYTPESAAEKLNQVFKDPMAWWSSEEVQQARKFFCEHLALTSDDWFSQWQSELKGVLNA